jgi:hypothetical protein
MGIKKQSIKKELPKKVNLCTLKNVRCEGFCNSINFKNECGILEKDKYKKVVSSLLNIHSHAVKI